MKGKVVIVTGGSSGIGKALAQYFGHCGFNVVITGRKLEDLEQTRTQLEKEGISCMIHHGDVSNEEDNKKMVEGVITRYGKIDVLINNAGISMRALFQDTNMDVIRKVMDINFFGAVSTTQHCLPHIIKSKGSIVGISSIAGYRGLPGRSGYSASKFALNGFLEALRTELIKTGVHILIACPGFTATNIRKRSLLKDGTPQGDSPREEDKMMTAEECAKQIYKATVNRKKTLVLTTQGKLTVFLNKWAPGIMDRIVYSTMAKEANSPFK